jgi:hypothetical protein
VPLADARKSEFSADDWLAHGTFWPMIPYAIIAFVYCSMSGFEILAQV